ncbi:glycosyl transferase [hydrothermal vent metagenome]|uniref:Glycosyl transferase n=1 Tax=hydrothermal vent metagenome TaxID=652676 RepID=A0A3B1AZI6_9ZZZZ
MRLKNLSIIIPLGPDEDQFGPLMADLSGLGLAAEIIVVSCDDNVLKEPAIESVRVIKSRQGRALQQNAGAKAASREFLWFLHADSRLSERVIAALEAAIKASPRALHYYHLKFCRDGPAGMAVNEWGAWFRSEILRIPFGDQGFCLRKDIFHQIGGFPQDAPYGEDHLLVWYARQAGVKLRCTGADLPTSARKYAAHGWFALTVKYQWRWIRQALPEAYKFLLGRLNRR